MEKIQARKLALNDLEIIGNKLHQSGEEGTISSTITAKILKKLEEIKEMRNYADYSGINVALYESFGNEPPTQNAINTLSNLGVKVYLPVWKDESGYVIYKWRLYKDNSQQQIGLMPEDVDIMFIPALSIDEKGNRLGRGGGWFDRVLVNFIGSVPIYAICYASLVVKEYQWSIEKHDIKVDGVIAV